MKTMLFIAMVISTFYGIAMAFDVNQNLEMYYPFDQTDGISVIDAAGNHPGTIKSLSSYPALPQAGYWDAAGKFNGALYTDQTTEGAVGVDVSAAARFSNFNNKTISMWFRPDASIAGINQNFFLWSNRNSGSDAFKIYIIYRNNSIQVVCSSANRTIAIAPPDGNTWYHIACVFRDQTYDTDLSGNPGTFVYTDVDVYLDGDYKITVPKNFRHVDGAINGPSIAANAVDVAPLSGGVGSAGHQTFIGSIDEVRVYDYSLDAADVAELYAYTPDLYVPQPFDPDIDLATYWPLNETSGYFAADQAGFHPAAVMYPMPDDNSSYWLPTEGKFDGAIRLGDNTILDGTNQHVLGLTIADSAYGNYQDKTMAFWFSPDVWDSSKPAQYILSIRPSGSDQPIYTITLNSNTIRVTAGDNADRKVVASSAITYNPAVKPWYHVAVVTQNTGDGLSDYHLYLDGVYLGTARGALRFTNGILYGASLGANALDVTTITHAPNSYQGKLDEFRIYDKVLSSADIAALAAYTPQASTAEQEIDLKKDLRLYYNCDETSGDILADSAGVDALNGIIKRAPSNNNAWYTGAYDGGVWLDSSLLSCIVPENSNDKYSLGNTNDKTFSLWYRPDQLVDGDKFLIGTRNTASQLYRLYLLVNQGKVKVSYDKDRFLYTYPGGETEWRSNVITLETSMDVLSPGEWTHVALVTANNDYGQRSIQVYINGELLLMNAGADQETGWEIGDLTFGGFVGNLTPSSGVDPTAFWSTVSGTLDEIRVYGRPLNAGEVRKLYNYGPIINGDINGDAVCGTGDLTDMSGQWLDSNLSVAGTESVIANGDFEGYSSQAALEAQWAQLPYATQFYETVSTVTLLTSPAETFSGSKALRWTYDNNDPNTNQGGFTEIINVLDQPIDLANHDLMSVMINRHVGNSLEKALYVKFLTGIGTISEIADDMSNQILAQALIKYPDGSSSSPTGWDEWIVDLNDLQYPFGDTRDDLANVGALLFGVYAVPSEGIGGGQGVIDIDDIKVMTLPQCNDDLMGDVNGDCNVNFNDFTEMSWDWLVENMQPAGH